MRVGGVDAQFFVAGAGNREVARGECRCDFGIGVWAGVACGGWSRKTVLDVCASMALSA